MAFNLSGVDNQYYIHAGFAPNRSQTPKYGIETFSGQETFEMSGYSMCEKKGCKAKSTGNSYKGNSRLCKHHLDEELESLGLQKTK